jgi:hypothetical protein
VGDGTGTGRAVAAGCLAGTPRSLGAILYPAGKPCGQEPERLTAR